MGELCFSAKVGELCFSARMGELCFSASFPPTKGEGPRPTEGPVGVTGSSNEPQDATTLEPSSRAVAAVSAALPAPVLL